MKIETKDMISDIMFYALFAIVFGFGFIIIIFILAPITSTLLGGLLWSGLSVYLLWVIIGSANEDLALERDNKLRKLRRQRRLLAR